MRGANQALLQGLSPEQFKTVAAAADTLGDAVGVGTKEAMEALAVAAATGNERLAKQFGIVIDNKKAEEEFAKSIGTTADQLSELGKREAARLGILEKIEEQTAKLGTANATAGDALQRMGATAANVFDRIAQAVNESEALTFEMNRLADSFDSVTNSSDPLKRELKAVAEEIATLKKLQERDISTVPFQLQGKFQQGALAAGSKLAGVEQYEDFLETTKLISDKFLELNGRVESFGKASRTSADDIDRFTQHTKAAKEKITELKDSLPDFLNLNKALGNGDAFASLSILYGKEAGEEAKKFFDMTEEMAKEAYKNSVSFFEDILTTSITGSAQSMEQILTDALKRVAIGFGSQLLAEIAASMGGTGLISQIGSASGLGQYIAGGIASLFKGADASPLDIAGQLDITGQLAGVNAQLTQINSSLSTTASNLGISSLSLSSIAAAAPVALAGAAGIGGAFAYFNNSNKKPVDAAGASGASYLAGDVTGISQTYFALTSLTGRDEKKRQESEARQAILDQIREQSGLSFDESTHNVDTSTPGGQSAVGFGNPLGHLVSGGSGKTGSDLAGIFANAIGPQKTFNAQLVEAQALMGKLGFSAEDAKNQLRELFLDGKISAAEFGTDIQNLNLLAQNNLVGPNSISDAAQIVAENLSGSPRTALQGLALEFNELREIGIDTPKEVSAYFMDKFGPNIASVMEQIATITGGTFEGIRDSSNENLGAIFNLLNSVAGELYEIFGIVPPESGTEQGLKRLNGLLKTVETQANKTYGAINGVSSGASGGRPRAVIGDSNKQLATFR
jgi:hypothetical protein